MCKNEVKQIFVMESDSQTLKSVAVTHRRQEEIVGECTACSDEINVADIVRSCRHTEQNIENMNANTMTAMCHGCQDNFIHVKCMHEADKEEWTATHEWVCPYCVSYENHVMSDAFQAAFLDL